MTCESQDTEQLMLDAVDKFLITIKPQVHQLEADDEYPEEIVEQIKEMGLFGAVIDHQIWWLGITCKHICKNR